MNLSRWAFGVLAALSLGLCGIIQGQELPTLREVRERYQQALPPVETLQYQLERQWVQLQPLPAEVRLFDPTEFERVQFWSTGSRVALQTDSISRSGTGEVQDWMGFNGQSFAAWRHSLRAPEGLVIPPTGKISLSAPNELRGRLLETFLGHRWLPDAAPAAQALPELLKQPGTRVLRWEEVGGVRCVAVEVPASGSGPEMQQRLQVWFDPTHNYLPRRIREVDNAAGPPSGTWWDNDVLEFAEIGFPDGSRGWLPARCVSRSSDGVIEWRLTFSGWVLNGEIPSGIFEPEFPFGTMVYDETAANRDPVSFVGGQAGAEYYRELDEAHQAAWARLRPQLQLQPAALNAPGTASAWRLWLLIVAGLGAIAFGWLICRRCTTC